ncbi:penicillin-binding protein 2 [Azospirillum brasilense]|uniref:Penicillin-binding protein 2 n=1 Tax=Azospirillum brasilense TaxID=192 RepID=A0A0P0F365_AZOBR|nr:MULTISPECIES: penicillin-binding protein 2 [Azospirillum]ALJ34929.1 penicillin-binding protein 2 [Azospirillum brasilense]MDW7553412.1 penicillin-binding protein 2 [Azospirillum brasilense]MDW7594382.1 penicillin-binding protein 2 [Azospirillum brasilense]MDW7629254.1 penicillin-binding protein 2 [Azospirillum brasilense]MDX5953603.1 penicillin-binding protein 2 [Azospirillum brasilense]
MDRDTDRYRLLTRRAAVLGGLKLAGLSALVGRLYYLQVVESARYTMLAEENRISLRLVAPSRGTIVDRFGAPLAVNQQNYRVVVVSERTRNIQDTLDKISKIVPLTDGDRRRVMRELHRKRRFVPVTVRENLTWEQVATIEMNTPDLPGVAIEVGEIRHYPEAEATAHILGYVGAVSEAELNGDPVLSLPGFRIGKAGMEKYHEKALRGTAGTSQLEVNAVGRVIRELSRDEGQPGREVQLTIDIGLQKFVQQRLSQEVSASCVVMDVHTGGIYALCSHPSYDPNQFTMGISAELWEELLSNQATPLNNKAVAGQYPPGSTFKPVVALAALESGLISRNHTVFCPGHMDLGDHRFHCWKKGGHGTVDVVGALRHSCDVWFYDVSRRIGIDRIAEMANRFDMGQLTGLDLPHERPGLIPSIDWKKGALGKPWAQGETLIAAIGQGYVLSTPMQLVAMTARLANGGFAVKPHLTKQIKALSGEQTSWPPIGVKKENLDLVLRGLYEVTNAPNGTAYKSRITEPGYEMAGKTGSAQVRRITMAERSTGVKKNEDLPWRERDHALFISYAPVSSPRYACAVFVEHGGGGSTAAAPIARDILLECQKRDPGRAAVAESAPPPPPPGGTRG